MKSKNIYSLPLKKGTIYLANSDSRAHYSYWKYSIDFLIDFNIPILAPLNGEVWDVKDDSKEGGNNEKYAEWKYQNLVTLKHDNEEYSQYVHLAHKSVCVKIGDKVKKGEVIAKGIGIVGYTTAPHLHMMVFVDSKNKAGWKSVEIQFDRNFKVIRSSSEYLEAMSKPRFKGLRKLEEEHNKR